MAKGDIVAKLVLNNKDFDGKLAKSKKEVASMKNLGSQVFGGMANALKGYAVAAGAAVTVSEAFKAVIGSSQGLTDAWGRSLEATKTVFDNFVYSISNADFSSFESGLSSMIDKAKEAYNAFDQLANTKMSADFVTTLDQSKYREAMSRARNKNLTREEREAALQEARGYLGTIQEAGAKLSADSEKALKAKIAAKSDIGEEYITAQMIEDVFRVDARFSSEEERKAIKREYEAYLAAVEEAKKRAKQDTNDFIRQQKFALKGTAQYRQNILQAKEFNAAREAEYIAATHQQYAGSVTKYLALERFSDEELASDMQIYLQSVNAKNAAAEMVTSINEVGISIANEAKAASAKLQAVVAPTSPTLREVPMAMRTLSGMDVPQFDKGELPTTISLEEQSKKLQEAGVGLFRNDKFDQMDEAAKKAETLTNAFNTLGGAIGGSAGKMFEFAGSITDAVSTMLPFIAYLQAEAAKHDAAANSALKEAAANTLASYSGIPFAGVALGAAAVASIVGVMKSLPMLAEGGVVTGPTVAMIGEAGKEAVIPLDKLNDFVDTAPREVRVRGEIRASGKDLVVTIDNYNKVRRVK